MGSQLHELVANGRAQGNIPHLNTLADIYLSIPVGTAFAERSFSQMRISKTYVHIHLIAATLPNLMIVVIE